MTIQDLYQQKLQPAAEAVRQVRDGDLIIVPTGVGEPPALLTALSVQRRDFRDVKVSQILAMRKYAYIDPETTQHVRHVALFFGGATRAGGQEGWIDFIPNYFSEIPAQIERGQIPADVVFSMASPMDAHGYFALSLGADYTMAAVARARAVVLEVNPNVPFANGNCHVHVSQVAALVESSDPVLEVGLPKIGPVQQAIGKHVAELIEDGSTLQIGYGGIPDAVVMQLTDKRDLGIHTEMLGDGILTLIEAGVVTNRRKNYLPGKTIATFALGSNKLYRFMDRNPAVEIHPVNFTNDPALAGLNDNLVAINATLQIDLLGQCGSESLGHAPFSGTGGQSDFVRAANRSRGGKAFIVLPSTAKGDTISRIVPSLSPGTHVSTSKNDINYVVTEHGVAQLRGKSAKQRAQELIAIAHPDFRADLTEQAKRAKLL
ncbi:acetyl-CoA hydrolase/transferase C-terminal domain-containing protein [Variovorax sp. J31P179]|jgi:acyl-CoA hydrolase|uniref:acetyl-CoA hydrolase/transferase family protein n=1 Tax=Variovorax sp. J31P179 TaxID=3053508 RepID=UPI002575F0EE|nr:acetyl-CoA hydrolase/transferase C-terminal domain-containing protein [Variovorax sp. J31P179]MDM0082087.1 acetyl-CoA hydrolase/transferase C-terminal domain-containing protein [Variovorax sp. J31P179]